MDNEVEKIISDYQRNVNRLHNDYLSVVGKYARELGEDSKEYKELMENLLPGYVSYKSGMHKNIRKFDTGASFKVLLSNYMIEKKYLKGFGYNVAPPGNIKKLDSKIFELAGVQSPKILAYGCHFTESDVYDEVVIKPTVGSNSAGVFVKSKGVYKKVNDGRLLDRSEATAIVEKFFKNKKFMIEEAALYKGGAAKDFKVYCFYGVPALILEVDRSNGKPVYCFYDSNGDIASTGKHPDSLLFSGAGVSDEIFDISSRLSSDIPSSFIRLDFLMSDKGVFGGEVTSHPGRYFDFNKHWDRLLGIEFLKARARLTADLFSGKNFKKYHSIMSN